MLTNSFILSFIRLFIHSSIYLCFPFIQCLIDHVVQKPGRWILA